MKIKRAIEKGKGIETRRKEEREKKKVTSHFGNLHRVGLWTDMQKIMLFVC